MPYDVAEVKKMLGFNRSSDIADSDYDEWEEALEKTGRIIPYDSLPPDMQVNIRFQTNTKYRDFALNEWLEPKNDTLGRIFGFNSPFASYDLHWRWDKVGDMWYFRVLFPFEPVSKPYQFNQGGIVSQNKTFFDSRQSDFNNTLFELGEKVAQDFFDEKGIGYGSEVFFGDYDSGVKEYSDEIGFTDYGRGSGGIGQIESLNNIKTEVYVAKKVESGVKNMHEEAFLLPHFTQLNNFFKLIETKDGFFIPYMKSCSFITETNYVIVYDEEILNNGANGLFMYLPSIQVKGRLYFEAGFEHEYGIKRNIPIFPSKILFYDGEFRDIQPELFSHSVDPSRNLEMIRDSLSRGENKGTLTQYLFLGGNMHDSEDSEYGHKIEIRVLGADFDDSIKGMGIINHTIIGFKPRVVVADIPKGGA